MKEQDFVGLCHSLCLEFDLANKEPADVPQEFLINGYRLGLYLDSEVELIDCYMDLGFIEEDRRFEVFGRILEINLEMTGLHGESLGFDAETGHLVLRSAIRTELGCDADSMGQLLKGYTEFADSLKTMLREPAGKSPSPVLRELA